MSAASDFMKALKPASFRGVPFGVTDSKRAFGRRVAIHEYPFRDVQWAEDLGRKGRRLGFRGFLVADSLKYGGGAVLDQEQALIKAVETKGPGKLVHPTLGDLNVTCLDCSISDSVEAIGVLAVDFEFYEAGERVFPTLGTGAGANVKPAADATDVAASSDLGAAITAAQTAITIPGVIGQVQGAVGAAAGVVTAAVSTVQAYAGQISSLVGDATNLFGLASLLPGNFGRFFNGANLAALVDGGPTIVATPYTGDETIDQLVSASAGQVAAVGTAVAALNAVAANLGAGANNNTPADLAAAAQTAIAALTAAAPDPANAIRLLGLLATYTPPPMVTLSAVGSAIGDMVRRSAVAEMAEASTLYQPSSANDALAVMTTVTGYIDHEIGVAGNQGEDASFAALRTLRAEVVKDLVGRGADLAPLAVVVSAEPQPALVLAQRLYRDAGRADQMVLEAGPDACISPLFMPVSFSALAA